MNTRNRRVMCMTLVLVLITTILLSCSIENEKNEILWDCWGVPHIYSSNEQVVYFSFGWSQAQSHGDLMLKLYGQARGRAAEYWGDDFLDTDILIHTLELYEMADNRISAMPEHELTLIQSFSDGINAYINNNPDHISERMKAVLPVTPVDIVAHSYRAFYLEFLVRRVVEKTDEWIPGSNGWAIGPKKSESGNAMLLANPHLPWFDFWMFYEAHLNTGGQNLYGVTLVGLPFIGVGFNSHLGWTHTVNTVDNVDAYEVKIKDDKYLLDGAYFDMEKKSRTVKIKNDDGSFQNKKIVVRKTAHGVITGDNGSHAVAVRFSKMNTPPGILQQWYDMGNSVTLNDFRSALNEQGLPFFNVLYADAGGNIMYYFGGHVPVKACDDWEFWQNPVDGSKAKYIWREYHSSQELPQVCNPETGWLQNANDPPYTCTIPSVIDPDSYPGYMAPNYMTFRAQQSARLLMNDDHISFEEMIQYKHSTRSMLADRILDDLIALKPLAEDALTKQAIDLLEKWDRCFEKDSKGAVLFIEWIKKIAGSDIDAVFENPWEFGKPMSTPSGLKNKKSAVRGIALAAKEVKKLYGALDVQYGDIYRAKAGNYDVPVNGGHGKYGIFRTVRFLSGPENRFLAYHGDAFVAAVEFGKPVRAKVILNYGNASQKRNAHIGDQLNLFSKKEMRDALLTRKQVMRHLEKREVIKVQ